MRVPRWLTPIALLVASAGSGGAAVAVEASQPDLRPSRTGATLTTPVLSARRVPSVLAEPIADRRLRADLAAWAESVPDGSCAVVLDPRGEVVLDHHGDLPVVPASTLKLLTATAALEQLGPEHRFRTTVVAPPPVDGVIAGDLVLVGGGDPVLATVEYAARYPRQPQIFTNIAELADRIMAAGVRRITGAVVGDESRYDRQRYVEGWPGRYLAQHVTGPLSSLSVNDAFSVHSTATQWREPVPAADPAAHAAAVLTAVLEERGVAVDGSPRAGTAPAGVPELAAVESPPVTEVVRQLLEESDNSTAELLLKEIGHAAGAPSTAGGLAHMTAVLEAGDLDLAGSVLADGSGLSLDNRVTCGILVDVLRRPGTGEVLRDALPVAGRTGTLQDVFVDTPLAGQLAAKTGSLNTVAGLAGTVSDDDGTLTFAYVVNTGGGRTIDGPVTVASQARLGRILLDQPRIPDLDALGPRPPVLEG